MTRRASDGRALGVSKYAKHDSLTEPAHGARCHISDKLISIRSFSGAVTQP